MPAPASDGHQSPAGSRWPRRRAWVSILLLVAGIGWLGWRTLFAKSGVVPGQLTIKVEQGFEIFIGEKAFHSNEVTITLADLLGQSGGEPLAIPLGADVLKPSQRISRRLPKTRSQTGDPFPYSAYLEQLAQSGAQILDYSGPNQSGFEGGSPLGKWSRYTFGGKLLLRRANGQLDLIELQQIETHLGDRYSAHFLVPIRLRSSDPQGREYTLTGGSGTMGNSFPQHPLLELIDIPAIYDHVLSMDHAQKFTTLYSRELEAEVLQNGLYRPGEGKRETGNTR